MTVRPDLTTLLWDHRKAKMIMGKLQPDLIA